MQSTDKIWLDGKLIAWEDAKVHVLSNVIHYGTGVFEGIRSYKTDNGGAIFRLDDHVKRLFYSAKCLGIKIPFSEEEIKQAIISTVKANNLKECYIRPVAFCGYDKLDLDITGSKVNVAIIVWPWGAIHGHQGVSAIISKYRRLSPRAVPIDAKIVGYYVNSVITNIEAKKRGANESILLDDDGNIAEGAGENVFLVKKGKIYTPSKEAILPGITRDSAIKIAGSLGLKVTEKKITVNELKKADEVFFTGTAVEICPVVELNGKKIGNGTPGIITLDIKKEYDGVIRGKNGKYKKWLSFV